MALGLIQVEMNAWADVSLALLPSESVTYKTSSTVSTTVCGHFSYFTKHEIQIDPMLRNMRKFRMATDAVTASPARKDVIVRSDGTTYDVDQVDGGPGRPFWSLTVRQVK